jgi:hypothetical protein
MEKKVLIIVLFIFNFMFSQERKDSIEVKPVFKVFNKGTSFTSITIEKSVKPAIWAGTDKKGLHKKRFESSPDSDFSILNLNLTNYTIQTVAADARGNVWVGHRGLGDTYAPDYFLSSNEGGLDVIIKEEAKHLIPINDDCDTSFIYRYDAHGYATRNVKSITVDVNNTVWLAQAHHMKTLSGKSVLTPGSLSFKKQGDPIFTTKARYSDRNSSSELPSPLYSCDIRTGDYSRTPGARNCNAIASDATSVWMAYTGYESTSDKDKPSRIVPSKIIQYDLEGRLTGEFFASDAFKLGAVTAICANDKRGTWVSTLVAGNGFSVYKSTSEKDCTLTWHHLDTEKLPNIIPAGAKFNANAIWKNEYGNVFLGTDKGLIVYDGRGPVNEETSYRLYTTEDGLISNNILGGVSETVANKYPSQEDKKIYQWIATDNGIIKTDIGSETETETETLQKNENITVVEEEFERRNPSTDRTYHRYDLKTEICEEDCDKCTKEAVYKMMSENVEFQAVNPKVMNNDPIQLSFLAMLNDDALKSIVKTINNETDTIEYANMIFIKAIPQYYSVYMMNRLLLLSDMVTNIPSYTSNMIYDKQKLYELQILDNDPACESNKTYNLYNHPVFISNRSIMRRVVNNIACGPGNFVKDDLYDPITIWREDYKHTITNYTNKGHMLFPGFVERKITSENGKIYVVTKGEGYHFCDGPIIGYISKQMNIIAGSIMFKNVDINFKNKFNENKK